MTDDIKDALAKGFAHDSALYRERGFMRRVGFGRKPALIDIDMANAWTWPGVIGAAATGKSAAKVPAVNALS